MRNYCKTVFDKLNQEYKLDVTDNEDSFIRAAIEFQKYIALTCCNQLKDLTKLTSLLELLSSGKEQNLENDHSLFNEQSKTFILAKHIRPLFIQ